MTVKTIKEFRNIVPVTKEWAYLETASTGLIPDFVYEGVKRYQDDRFYKGGDSLWKYGDKEVGTLEMIERSKAAIAEMINGSCEEIAFGQSSTQMFTMVTEGIDYSETDNVVTVADGWIGNRFAWQKREAQGLEVRYVKPVDGKVTVSMLKALCDENTRAITVNLVESKTGYRMNIDELGEYCKANNILLFVDAVQAVGALKVDVKKSNIDFLVGNDYKWMMNFCGTGYAYISNKMFSLIKHWGAGWMSDCDRFDTSKEHIDMREDAGRFEIGYPHADGIYGMGLVAKNNCELGLENIEKYVCALGDYFRQQIEVTEGVRNTYQFDQANHCQIASIKVSPEFEITNEMFENAKVFAHVGQPDINGEKEIRVSFHYYNNEEDIDRFMNVIRKEAENE